MTYRLTGYAVIEQAGLLDIADAYRRVADVALQGATAYAAGLPDVELREQLDGALTALDWRVQRLAAARRGYGRLEQARIDRTLRETG